ncbi:MAG: hypothetical protein WC005_05870 [Candidatus Nanopelagicales bacterium]
MPAWNAFSYAFGPLFALIGVGALILVLRWAFSRGKSVVAAAPRPGSSAEYGLLVAVATPSTYVEGETLRRRLQDAGLRANLATTLDGPRVLVWPADVERAKALLRS